MLGPGSLRGCPNTLMGFHWHPDEQDWGTDPGKLIRQSTKPLLSGHLAIPGTFALHVVFSCRGMGSRTERAIEADAWQSKKNSGVKTESMADWGPSAAGPSAWRGSCDRVLSPQAHRARSSLGLRRGKRSSQCGTRVRCAVMPSSLTGGTRDACRRSWMVMMAGTGGGEGLAGGRAQS